MVVHTRIGFADSKNKGVPPKLPVFIDWATGKSGAHAMNNLKSRETENKPENRVSTFMRKIRDGVLFQVPMCDAFATITYWKYTYTPPYTCAQHANTPQSSPTVGMGTAVNAKPMVSK